ncbi:MAG: hypothetical protein IKL18_08545 [Oscillospiraceae bacterium]|nr:hypothetical protein [Oscillospiraceae bacterium]MBR6658200.1 hypothetical protein [Oscillospiraceae bacterium]
MDKNIIVIGHVDHGKSTFMNALNLFINGKQPEAFAPPISSVSYRIGEDNYTVFDYGGAHEYIEHLGEKNEWAAILVCAATDGPMPQTTEQIELCNKRGIKRIALYMSKCDLADDDDLQYFVQEDINDILAENGFETEYPLLKVSAERACDWGEEKDKKEFFRFLTEIHRMK